jgi:hypothetical protein
MSKFGTIQSYKQKLWLKDRWVSGVNSVDAEFAIPNEQINSIGLGFVDSFRVGDFEGSFSFSHYLLGQDFFYELLQEKDIDGIIDYDGHTFGIKQGIITNYSCSGSINSIIESSISGVVFGKMGSSNFGITPTDYEDPFVSTLTSAGVNIVSGDGIEIKNRLLDFNIEITIQRNYKRIIGNSKPVQNLIVYPIVCNISLTAAVHDFQVPILESFECNEDYVNLQIMLNQCDGEALNEFFFPNGKLTNVKFSSDIDNELTVALDYEILSNDIIDFISPDISGESV